MKPSVVESIRWAIVGLFALLAWWLCTDANGTTALDFGVLLVVGAVAFVAIVFIGWVNGADRPDE